MKFISAIARTQRSIEKGACYTAAGLVFIMIFPTSVDVILRYLFNAPLPEIFQLTEFMMVGVVYLAISYVQALKDHIKIEIVTSWLPKKAQEALDLFGYLVGLFIFSIIAWQSGRQAWEAWVTQDYTMGIVQFPVWPAKSILPLGVGLLCLRLILDIMIGFQRLLRAAPDSHDPIKEDA
ncbi:MAG: TRAP transporter small permease [Deltaproteobacteria bacterium]|nr:TRAP transporter small permease [Deltaproteobacteria bacterium]